MRRGIAFQFGRATKRSYFGKGSFIADFEDSRGNRVLH